MSDGPRYNPSDFADLLPVEPEARNGNGTAPPVEIGDLILDPQAVPGLENFMALMDSSQKFRATFEHRRKDMQDQSPSSYDFAVANAAVRAGWSDQETADLIIYGRRKHRGDVEKALRQDYMRLTLAKVRQGLEHEAAVDAIAEHYAAEEDGRRRKLEPEAARELLTRALAVQVRAVFKYGDERPFYEVVLDVGKVVLASVDGLIVQRSFRKAIAEACDLLLPEFTTGRWRAIGQALLDLSEYSETGQETTDAGMVWRWLDTYLSSPQHVPAPATDERVKRRQPLLHPQQGVLFFLDSFETWIVQTRGEKPTGKWIARELRRLGSEPYKLNWAMNGKHTSRETWPFPKCPFDEDAEASLPVDAF